MDWKERIFTRTSGIRHLIMSGITVGVLIYTYVFWALLQHDWKWIANMEDVKNSQDYLLYIGMIFMFVGIASLCGILIYWNVVKWMLPFLLKSFINLLSAIPIVNLFAPPMLREKLGDEIIEWNKSDGGYYDADGYWIEGGLPLIIAIPIGIIVNLIRGFGMFIFYLICGIGIPLFSPIIVIFGFVGIYVALGTSNILLFIIGLLAIIFSICLYIIQPILGFKYD